MSSMHGKFLPVYSCARGIRVRILGSDYWRTAGSVSRLLRWEVCTDLHIHTCRYIYVCVYWVYPHMLACIHSTTAQQCINCASTPSISRGPRARKQHYRFSIVNKNSSPAGSPCLEKAPQELVTPQCRSTGKFDARRLSCASGFVVLRHRGP